MITNIRRYSKDGIIELVGNTYWSVGSDYHKRMVMLIQSAIAELTDSKYKPIVDGDYGSATMSAVRGMQQILGMPESGIMGHDEMRIVLSLYDDLELGAIDGAKWAYDHINYGDGKPFIEERGVKKMVVLHHTVSGGNPFSVSRYFSGKQYATHFVIGSDGTIVQTAPLSWWSWHINMRADNKSISKSHERYMAQSSIGIELCCWGALKEDGGKLYNSSGREMKEERCVRYSSKYNGSYWFERYTEQQIDATKVLLKALRDKGYFIPDRRDYMDLSWLQTEQAAIEGKRGLVSHTSLRKEGSKSDIHPQQEMLQMLQDTFGR